MPLVRVWCPLTITSLLILSPPYCCCLLALRWGLVQLLQVLVFHLDPMGIWSLEVQSLFKGIALWFTTCQSNRGRRSLLYLNVLHLRWMRLTVLGNLLLSFLLRGPGPLVSEGRNQRRSVTQRVLLVGLEVDQRNLIARMSPTALRRLLLPLPLALVSRVLRRFGFWKILQIWYSPKVMKRSFVVWRRTFEKISMGVQSSLTTFSWFFWLLGLQLLVLGCLDFWGFWRFYQWFRLLVAFPLQGVMQVLPPRLLSKRPYFLFDY